GLSLWRIRATSKGIDLSLWRIRATSLSTGIGLWRIRPTSVRRRPPSPPPLFTACFLTDRRLGLPSLFFIIVSFVGFISVVCSTLSGQLAIKHAAATFVSHDASDAVGAILIGIAKLR